MMRLISCSPDHILQNDWTALHVAANKGKTKIVKLLLDYRADINAVDVV